MFGLGKKKTSKTSAASTNGATDDIYSTPNTSVGGSTVGGVKKKKGGIKIAVGSVKFRIGAPPFPNPNAAKGGMKFGDMSSDLSSLSACFVQPPTSEASQEALLVDTTPLLVSTYSYECAASPRRSQRNHIPLTIQERMCKDKDRARTPPSSDRAIELETRAEDSEDGLMNRTMSATSLPLQVDTGTNERLNEIEPFQNDEHELPLAIVDAALKPSTSFIALPTDTQSLDSSGSFMVSEGGTKTKKKKGKGGIKLGFGNSYLRVGGKKVTRSSSSFEALDFPPTPSAIVPLTDAPSLSHSHSHRSDPPTTERDTSPPTVTVIPNSPKLPPRHTSSISLAPPTTTTPMRRVSSIGNQSFTASATCSEDDEPVLIPTSSFASSAGPATREPHTYLDASVSVESVEDSIDGWFEVLHSQEAKDTLYDFSQDVYLSKDSSLEMMEPNRGWGRQVDAVVDEMVVTTTSDGSNEIPTTSIPTTSIPTTSIPTTTIPTTSIPTTSIPTTTNSIPTTTTSIPTTTNSIPTTTASIPTTTPTRNRYGSDVGSYETCATIDSMDHLRYDEDQLTELETVSPRGPKKKQSWWSVGSSNSVAVSKSKPKPKAKKNALTPPAADTESVASFMVSEGGTKTKKKKGKGGIKLGFGNSYLRVGGKKVTRSSSSDSSLDLSHPSSNLRPAPVATTSIQPIDSITTHPLEIPAPTTITMTSSPVDDVGHASFPQFEQNSPLHDLTPSTVFIQTTEEVETLSDSIHHLDSIDLGVDDLRVQSTTRRSKSSELESRRNSEFVAKTEESHSPKEFPSTTKTSEKKKKKKKGVWGSIAGTLSGGGKKKAGSVSVEGKPAVEFVDSAPMHSPDRRSEVATIEVETKTMIDSSKHAAHSGPSPSSKSTGGVKLGLPIKGMYFRVGGSSTSQKTKQKSPKPKPASVSSSAEKDFADFFEDKIPVNVMNRSSSSSAELMVEKKKKKKKGGVFSGWSSTSKSKTSAKSKPVSPRKTSFSSSSFKRESPRPKTKSTGWFGQSTSKRNKTKTDSTVSSLSSSRASSSSSTAKSIESFNAARVANVGYKRVVVNSQLKQYWAGSNSSSSTRGPVPRTRGPHRPVAVHERQRPQRASLCWCELKKGGELDDGTNTSHATHCTREDLAELMTVMDTKFSKKYPFAKIVHRQELIQGTEFNSVAKGLILNGADQGWAIMKLVKKQKEKKEQNKRVYKRTLGTLRRDKHKELLDTSHLPPIVGPLSVLPLLKDSNPSLNRRFCQRVDDSDLLLEQLAQHRDRNDSRFATLDPTARALLEARRVATEVSLRNYVSTRPVEETTNTRWHSYWSRPRVAASPRQQQAAVPQEQIRTVVKEIPTLTARNEEVIGVSRVVTQQQSGPSYFSPLSPSPQFNKTQRYGYETSYGTQKVMVAPTNQRSHY